MITIMARIIELDSGTRFGRWVVLRLATALYSGGAFWLCQCDCGAVQSVSGRNLRTGQSRQCNDCARNHNNLIGQKFFKWTVIRKIDRKEALDGRIWKCRCECGREQRLASNHLTRGLSKSCKRCMEKPAIRIRPYEALFNWARKRSGEEGHEFSIPYEEFVELCGLPICHYCLAPIFFARHCVNKTGHKYNLDRKDNSLGYVSGNLVPCCKRCNFAKGNRFTYQEWWTMTACFRNAQLALPL